jgi:peptidoglycan-N-acetylglucosamine deacetylase
MPPPDLQGSTMPRKLAAIVATSVAAVLVVGVLTAVALGNRTNTPPPAATAVSAPAVVTPSPSITPSVTPPGAPSSNDSGPFGPTASGRVVYLTFDDGPDPTWTPQVLTLLAKYGAKATFFELGDMVAAHPGLQEQIRAAGHVIGNHSVSHPVLTSLSTAHRHHELVDGPASRCFRPPYGATSAKLRAEITAAGMTQILWTIDPRDWDRPGTSAIVHNVLKHAYPGAVVLMHDGGGDRAQTIAALDKILRVLKGRGYSFPAMTC